MLFNSGNPSLLGKTRKYAQDPSTAANPLFSDQEVKDAINLIYLELRDDVRLLDVGYCRKRAYADGVAVDSPDDHFYELPADFVGKLRVEISTNGSNLSTTLPADDPSIKVLAPMGWDQALDLYNLEGESGPRAVFIHNNHFGISPPLTSTEAGTRSIRITYEASTSELSGDTDEPDLPRPHHKTIALGAAFDLLLGENLDTGDLERRFEIGRAKLKRAVARSLADYNRTIGVAGLTAAYGRATRTGSIRRRGRLGGANERWKVV